MQRNQVKDKKAYDAVIRARTMLLVTQPFFGCLALHLDTVEVGEETAKMLPTMAVDGVHLFYNPAFVNKITDAELVGVCAHEVMHCALQHITRRGHRNPVIYNMAGDYVINGDLTKAGFALPKPHLCDAKYDGMSSEEVYERIKEQVEKQLQKQAKEQGKGKKQKGDGEGGMSMPDTDLNVPDPGGCGGFMDAGGQGNKDKAQADSIRREWDANVRMAVNVAKRANAGKLPGYLDRLVSQLQEPKVSWRELTRQFIDNSMLKDYSWARPNRRFASQGLVLPGFVSDALHHLVMFIDVSGSVTHEMMTAMVSEGAGALNDGIADKLTVVYVDTAVRQVDEWLPGDLVQAKTVGGGGTDFGSCMKWAKDHVADAACGIFLTDMMTSDFGEDPGFPMLWGAYLPHNMLAQVKVPFGTVVAVDTSE